MTLPFRDFAIDPPAKSPALAAGRLTARLQLLLYLAATAIALSPLLWVEVPGLVDYPNHLARMWILAQGDAGVVSRNYLVHWRLVPNLAMDLVVPLFAQLMPVEVAGRLFIALTLALLLAGTASLHKALHGRVGFWPLAALLFFYNDMLYWGFLNCLFGLAACLLGLSGWIGSGGWRWRWRIPAFAAVAAALFILHLFAFGLYGLSVMSYELGRWRGQRRAAALRRWLLAGTQFIPALLLWLVSLAGSGPSFTHWGNLAEKLIAWQSAGLFGALPSPLDALLLVFCLAFLLFGRRSGVLRVAPEMRPTLAVLFLAALIMPEWLSGSWAADRRLPVAIAFILIAAIRIEPRHRRALAGFALAATMLFGLRLWGVTASWIDTDHHFAAFRAADRGIAPGARLLVVEDWRIPAAARAVPGTPLFLARRSPAAYPHMAALAVIDRGAFIPYLFTGLTPIIPNPRNAGLYQTQSEPITSDILRRSAGSAAGGHGGSGFFASGRNFLGEKPYWPNWPRHFDYVLWIDFGAGRSAPVPRQLAPMAETDFFRLYRVVKP